MRKVRFGLVGVGEIVREFHLPVMARNPRVEIVAACDVNADSAQRVARQFDIPKTCTDFNDLACDPKIEAALVSVPNHLHAPVTVAMLQGGKHVLCEKPMAMTAADAQIMLSATEAARHTLAIAHPWRCDQDVRWLRDAIWSGRLGKVFKVRGHAVITGDFPSADGWRCNPRMSGGGVLMDVGIHVIDTISFLFDDAQPPVRVTAHTANYFTEFPVEDTATVLLEYPGGMLAVIEAGWRHNFQHSPHGALEVFGAEGYARTFPTELRFRKDGQEIIERPSLHPERPHIDASMYATQIDSFLDALILGAKPPCDARQGYRNMLVLEAAYRSARSGETAQMNS